MKKFLIADDVSNVRKSFRRIIETRNYQCVEASDLLETIEAVNGSMASGSTPFDLILLDYDFGDGTTGFDAIQNIKNIHGESFLDYKVIVITGHHSRELPSEFAREGVVGHLVKPVSEPQLWATIDSVLTQQDNFFDTQSDWETAYELLNELGLIENIENLNQASNDYQALYETHQNLLKDISVANGNIDGILKAYDYANTALNRIDCDFDSILPALSKFDVTEHLIDDIYNVYRDSKIHFYALQQYLVRIFNNPHSYRVKHLHGITGHYEYRIGRNYRLYFRKGDGNRLILERYAIKPKQDKVIHFLSKSQNIEPINPSTHKHFCNAPVMI